jgi:hypothetical protein
MSAADRPDTPYGTGFFTLIDSWRGLLPSLIGNRTKLCLQDRVGACARGSNLYRSPQVGLIRRRLFFLALMPAMILGASCEDRDPADAARRDTALLY